MKTFVIALLVALGAVLFYYPSFVRIPSTEEVQRSESRLTESDSASIPPAGMAAAPSAQAPSAASAATTQTPVKLPRPSSTPKAATVDVPPATGRKVIVVGGGLAGLSAVIEAMRAGAQVYLLEKTVRLGGNSEKASSGMNAARTAAQIKLSQKDSVEEFYRDTMESGHGLSNPELVGVLTSQSVSAYEFLTSFDIDLSNVVKLGGHSRARTHHPNQEDGVIRNVGWEIMKTLGKYVNSYPRDRFTIIAHARLTSLIVEDGRVVGVNYLKGTHDEQGKLTGDEPRELRADAVVLATGGYSRAEDILAKYAPSVVALATTNGPFAEGDGLKAAEQVNASLVHMDKVQIHPTSFIQPDNPLAKTNFLAPEALRGFGGVLINHEGKRFVNELDTRDRVTNAIFKHCRPMKVTTVVDGEEKVVDGPVMAYLIMVDEAVARYPALKFYRAKGFISAYSMTSGVAEALNLPQENLDATFTEYNECFNRQGHCKDPFGKKDFPYPMRLNDMFHVMMITPAIHYTMGGLEIDTQARVLKASAADAPEGAAREVVPGLYAAGEVTGGVHGANRLGGNSLLECVVFGRIAGRAAAEQLPPEASVEPVLPVAEAADDSTPATENTEL